MAGTVSNRNEEGFSAVLEAFQSVLPDVVAVPMSSWTAEPEDSDLSLIHI